VGNRKNPAPATSVTDNEGLFPSEGEQAFDVPSEFGDEPLCRWLQDDGSQELPEGDFRLVHVGEEQAIEVREAAGDRLGEELEGMER